MRSQWTAPGWEAGPERLPRGTVGRGPDPSRHGAGRVAGRAPQVPVSGAARVMSHMPSRAERRRCAATSARPVDPGDVGTGAGSGGVEAVAGESLGPRPCGGPACLRPGRRGTSTGWGADVRHVQAGCLLDRRTCAGRPAKMGGSPTSRSSRVSGASSPACEAAWAKACSAGAAGRRCHGHAVKPGGSRPAPGEAWLQREGQQVGREEPAGTRGGMGKGVQRWCGGSASRNRIGATAVRAAGEGARCRRCFAGAAGRAAGLEGPTGRHLGGGCGDPARVSPGALQPSAWPGAWVPTDAAPVVTGPCGKAAWPDCPAGGAGPQGGGRRPARPPAVAVPTGRGGGAPQLAVGKGKSSTRALRKACSLKRSQRIVFSRLAR